MTDQTPWNDPDARTGPTPIVAPDGPAHRSDGSPGTAKRLYRSSDQKMLIGVCGGLGEYFEMDPTLIRILFAAGTLLGGAGIVVYIVLAVIMPAEDALDLDPRTAAQQTIDEAGRELQRAADAVVEKARGLLGNRPAPPSDQPPRDGV